MHTKLYKAWPRTDICMRIHNIIITLLITSHGVIWCDIEPFIYIAVEVMVNPIVVGMAFVNKVCHENCT